MGFESKSKKIQKIYENSRDFRHKNAAHRPKANPAMSDASGFSPARLLEVASPSLQNRALTLTSHAPPHAAPPHMAAVWLPIQGARLARTLTPKWGA
jgi:hypothetical protein